MCECCSKYINRRQFVARGSAALGAVSLMGAMVSTAEESSSIQPRKKKPAVVKVVFVYPKPEDCDAGKAESYWQEYNWHPYPGNQFRHDEQRTKFSGKIKEIAKRIGLQADVHPGHINTTAKAREYAAQIKSRSPDAVLVVCFAKHCRMWAYDIVKAVGVPGIIYVPTGATHNAIGKFLTDTPGLHFINSIENWEEIDRSLRAVHARKMIAQSRLICIDAGKKAKKTDKQLGFETVHVPSTEYNSLFDSIKPDDAIKNIAMAYKKSALQIMEVTDRYIIDAFRAHKTVTELLGRHGGDAIMINCLFLEHRKPCVSFSINNGNLTPCGCENDLNATLTMMLGKHLFGRGGFQHNPGFDTVRNHYFASHCTCATKLQGPDASVQDYIIRPFFHHLPKTAALDVQWTPGSPVILAKYIHGKEASLHGWTGKVIESPKCPPTGGCATRVLISIDGIDADDDITSVYAGNHPILYCADSSEVRCLKIFAKLYNITQSGKI